MIIINILCNTYKCLALQIFFRFKSIKKLESLGFAQCLCLYKGKSKSIPGLNPKLKNAKFNGILVTFKSQIKKALLKNNRAIG